MEIEGLIEEGLQGFSRLVLDHAPLRAEFEASVDEFFGSVAEGGGDSGGPAAPQGTRETVLAARRHIEWFVFERHSPSLRRTPVEGLLAEWQDAVSRATGDLSESFFSSFAGVFQITSVEEDGGGWVRDLAGYGEHPLRAFPSQPRPVAGDLLVGRLYPMRGEACVASTAAVVLRAPALVRAIESDLERTRIARGGSRVLHISQVELERMFWGAGGVMQAARATEPSAATGVDSAPHGLKRVGESDETRAASHTSQGASPGEPHVDAGDSPDPIGDARRWLEASGLSATEIGAVFARLAGEPFEAGRIVHGASDALGDILDEMAFSTDLDLTEARRLLTLAWSELRTPKRPEQAAPQVVAVDGGAQSAVAAFEEGRRAGGDLNQLFDQLERDLGLESSDGADDSDSPAPDFPGVVGAMVEEFLWETREVQGDAPRAERFEILRCLGRFGKDIGVFEELSASDLLRFSAFWLGERRELADGRAAAQLLDALEAFCVWAESAHEMPLNAEFGETLEKLRSSLPRITEANLTLGAAPEPAESDDTGELYEIVAARPHQGWKLLDRRGREHTACAPLELSRLLKTGDRLRGRIELDGQAVVFCLYPPEAAGLLPG